MGMKKWGFGMSPISSRMQARYDAASKAMDAFINKGAVPETAMVSEFKGMCNRCVRQDQWDWFSVYVLFDLPKISILKSLAQSLNNLRKSIQDNDHRNTSKFHDQLICNGARKLLRAYQDETNRANGYIYVLSRREEPDVLKIGMTTRSIHVRTKEINSSTGVLIPYGARAGFKTDDPHNMEREVHKALADVRVRPDREFFRASFSDAVRVIKRIVD